MEIESVSRVPVNAPIGGGCEQRWGRTAKGRMRTPFGHPVPQCAQGGGDTNRVTKMGGEIDRKVEVGLVHTGLTYISQMQIPCAKRPLLATSNSDRRPRQDAVAFMHGASSSWMRRC